MGRLRLIGRLAVRDLRRRPVEAVLLLLAITAATTTLTLGLVLNDVARDPFQSTREATAGPDVVASVLPLDEGGPADLASLEELTDAPGVVGHGGPYPATGAVMETRSRTADVQAVGRDPAPATIDRPDLTQGDWVRDGGIVVEAPFADALGVGAGDPVTLNGRSFQVAGVAVTTAVSPDHCLVGCYIGPPLDELPAEEAEQMGPLCHEAGTAPPSTPCVVQSPGLVWLTQADLRSLVTREDALTYVMHLELDDPAEAQAFVDERISPCNGPDICAPPGPGLTSWQEIQE